MRLTLNQEGYDLELDSLERLAKMHKDMYGEAFCTLLVHVSLEYTAVALRETHRSPLQFEVVTRQGGDTDDWALISYSGLTWVQAP